MTEKFVYVIYIETTPERLWQALTDAELTAQYWGHNNVSEWTAGSRWEHQRTDGTHVADVVGTVLESEPGKRLVSTWAEPDHEDDTTQVTFDIEQYEEIVRLTVTHEKLPDEANRDIAAAGWAAVLSNLKTFLETGHVLPRVPWEMP
jgi:uncharacterized protein YndB with AHSA1/START domain